VTEGAARGLVPNRGDDTVSVLDLTSGAVVGSSPVGRDPIGFDGPRSAILDATRGVAYVVLSYPPSDVPAGPHAAHQGTARSGFVQKVALDDLRKLGETRIDPDPGEAALSDDGKRLVVAHVDRSVTDEEDAGIDFHRANLAILDPDKILASGSAVPGRLKVCLLPRGVVLSPGAGDTAYVACFGEDAIAIADLRDFSHPVERIPIGPDETIDTYGPNALSRGPVTGVLAVANTVSKDVRFFDPGTKAFRATKVTLEGAPGAIAWSENEGSLFVVTQSPDALVVADPATGAITRARPLEGSCPKPVGVTVAAPSESLYVTCEGASGGPGTVVALDAGTLDVQKTYSVGVGPDRLALPRTP
jgi:DNA-binding beta-propeller fold protein YncE